MSSVTPQPSTTTPAFWAYSADRRGAAVLVRCPSWQAAQEEKARMRWSDAVTTGTTGKPMTEAELRAAVEGRGWRVVLVREAK